MSARRSEYTVGRVAFHGWLTGDTARSIVAVVARVGSSLPHPGRGRQARPPGRSDRRQDRSQAVVPPGSAPPASGALLSSTSPSGSGTAAAPKLVTLVHPWGRRNARTSGDPV